MVLRILSLIAGTLLILVGIVGIFVPVMPQITLILAGLALVGYASPKVRHALEPLVRRSEQRLRALATRLWERMRRR